MTIRVRPVDRGRSSRDPNRRTFYVNLAFAITVVVAVLILIGVGVTTWYDAHLAPAATVGGQTITKDQFLERASVEAFRIQQLGVRVRADIDAGRLTASQGQARIDSLNNALDDSQGAFSASIVEKLIDTTLQAKLATEIGVTVTPEQIDARIVEDKTRKEQRHVWLISVAPEVDTGKTEPTDAQKAAAKKKADEALTSIKGGKTFEEVAKAVSADASSTRGGDLGWIDTTAAEDPDWEAAIFKLEVNGLTDVILGADGTYRIGRVTEIAPAEVDPVWDQKLAEAKISVAAYRAAIASEVTRTALGDKIVADASAATTQRQVQELYIKAPASPPDPTTHLKVRHILYSPNDDPSAAKDVPESDPAWSKAELGAIAAYEKIKADPKQFDILARAESDESSARGDDGTGGKLPYYTAEDLDPAFSGAIFKEGLQAGQFLEPFKSSFGFHVVQIMYRPPDSDQMAKLKGEAAGGADFGQLARDNSDGPKAGKGGDIGWVGQGMLDDRLTKVILATPVGSLTEIIDLPNDGLYLFKVVAERTAAPDAEQLETIKSDAFSNWYNGKKAAVTITRDLLG